MVQRAKCEVRGLTVMELRFDSSQEFQTQAIESVVRLFDGQAKVESSIRYVGGAGFVSSPNRLDLSHDDLLGNLQIVQVSNRISAAKRLEFIEREIETVDGKQSARF